MTDTKQVSKPEPKRPTAKRPRRLTRPAPVRALGLGRLSDERYVLSRRAL